MNRIFEIIGLLIIHSPFFGGGIHAPRTGVHGKKMIANQCIRKMMTFIMIFTKNQKSH